MLLTNFFKADFSPRLIEIRTFTAVISLLFSIIAFGVDDLINSDGVLYMNMVRAFLEGGLDETAQLFNWPFFSILVSGIHLITGLSLERSGELLNVLLFVVFTDSLVLICSKLLPNPRHVFIATLFILGFTLLNDYRAYLFRDMGYWAFTGISIYLFMNYLEKPTWFYALSWQISMLFSILFRIEGAVLLLTLPFFVFRVSSHFKEAVGKVFQLWSLMIIFFSIALFIALTQNGFITAFGKITEILGYIDLSSLYENFRLRSEIINSEVLSKFDKGTGGIILASGLIIMMVHKLIVAIGIPYAIYYIYSYFFNNSKSRTITVFNHLIIYFIFINFCILMLFVFKQYFLSTRYGVMLVTGLLLLMLPRMCQVVDDAIKNKRKGVLAFTFLILIAGPIDSFTVSLSKAYIKNAAIWASENLPADSKTITSDLIINYYLIENNAKTQVVLDIKNRPLNTEGFDFAIVTIKVKSDGVKKYLKHRISDYEIVHTTSNKRGDTVYVLKLTE